MLGSTIPLFDARQLLAIRLRRKAVWPAVYPNSGTAGRHVDMKYVFQSLVIDARKSIVFQGSGLDCGSKLGSGFVSYDPGD